MPVSGKLTFAATPIVRRLFEAAALYTLGPPGVPAMNEFRHGARDVQPAESCAKTRQVMMKNTGDAVG